MSLSPYGNLTPSSIEELYKQVTDEEILYFYFGEFEADNWYPSPFREENKPSFTISYYNNKWVWRDFGISSKPKNGLSFVINKYKLSIDQARDKIYNDIINGQGISHYVPKKPPKSEKKDIACKIWKPKFTSTLDYWSKLDVSRQELIDYSVYEGQVWLNKRVILESTKYKPIFIYMFDKYSKIWKGYNPNANPKKPRDLKFFSNNISGHIQNFDKLGQFPNKDVLIITKSYKDCIVLNKLGYNAIAPHTESMFLAPWDIDLLKTMYKYIYVFYDNDTTGVTKCTMFTEQNDLYYLNVPLGLSSNNKNCKDPSDVVEGFGYSLLEDIILEKFSRDNI